MAKKKKKPEPKPEAKPAASEPSPGSRTARTLAILVLAGALGVAAGAVAAKALGLRERLPGASAADALERGDAAALRAAADADRNSPEQQARGALADALLLADFGGDAVVMDRLQGLKKADAAVRKSPEGLYARAVLTRAGLQDPALEGDLEAVEKDGPVPARLALATQMLHDQRGDEAWTTTQAAALEPGAPAYALVAAARLALTREDPRTAATLAERGLTVAPGHGLLLALDVLADALVPAEEEVPGEDDKDEEKKPPRKPKPKKGDRDKDDDDEGKGDKGEKGDKEEKGEADDEGKDSDAAEGRGDKPRGARKATNAEARVARDLERLSPRDAAVASWALQALALSRGEKDKARALAEGAAAEVAQSAELAARQADLHLLSGNLSAAEEVLTKALKQAPGNADLLLARARLRTLKVLPAGALRGDKARTRDDGRSLALPLGSLVVDATRAGLPLTAVLDASVAPDEKLRAAYARGGADLESRLGIVEQIWRAEQALLRGDVPTAAEAAAAARVKAPKDVDALLADASAKLLQGDRAGLKEALTTAVEGAGDDPRVLLAAARVAYDAEDFAAARTWLKELQSNGTRSPSALAMSAMVTAREGDAKGAQGILKEAEAMSGDDIDVLRARLVLARTDGDLGGVRKAADRLLKLDGARSPDPLLRAWQGEALARQGDATRAEAVLQSVLAARPTLIDAHLAMGIALLGERPLDAAASFAQVIQQGGDAPLVAEATRRRATIKGAPPVANAPKGKTR